MFNAAYQFNDRFASLLPAGPDTRVIRAGRQPARNAAGILSMLRIAIAAVRSLLGMHRRFRQVDYRSFRGRLDTTLSGRVRRWGRYTYLYDCRNRLVAVTRAARVDASGRCVPVSYFVRCMR